MDLDINNLPANIFDTGKICPECGEHILAARVKFGAFVRTIERPCSCRNAKILAEDKATVEAKAAENRLKRYKWAAIPELFRESSLNKYERRPGTEQAYEAVKTYLLNREDNISAGKGLLLYGPCGTGKTHLGCAILNRVLADSHTAAYWNVPEMFDLLLPGRAESNEQGDVLDKAYYARVLLLDDLGAEKPSEWTQKQLTIIVDARYRDNKPTIITTNNAGKDLLNSCGGRVYSRLMDSRKMQLVELTAEDYRRRKI
ncbi:MAG TPA: ATP-binding protein [Caproiciproducens sp.]|nr:ATP-binding protein [Caproiciproducens sp.]